MSEAQTTKWYSNLLSQLNSIAEEFELDPIQSERFRSFTFEVAKDQFKAGNKSGIAWLHRQLRDKGSAVPAAA